MKKQIGICALIAVLVLVAVGCASFTTATEYITNIAFVTAVERRNVINWTKEEDGTVPLTPENLKAIRAIRELDISDMELTDLSGIEWFSKLAILDCSGNRLTELDLSQNSNLWILWCNSNQLRSLDLSHNTALVGLDCSTNRLTDLDVSHNTALVALDCSSNHLTKLDVSNNIELDGLGCTNNQLSELDVSQNTALEVLYCGSNQLSGLDVSQNTALTELYCYENQLRSLDVSHNPTLEELWCSDNQLKSLDLSQNPALTLLSCFQQSAEGSGSVAKHCTGKTVLRRSENIRWRGTAINTDIDGGAERNMGWVLGECKI